MAQPSLTIDQMVETLIAFHESNDNAEQASASIGIPRTTFLNRLRRAQENPEAGAIASDQMFTSREVIKATKVAKPRAGVKRFIVSSAQDGTEVHEGFLHNLKAYAHWLDCDILIGGFTYNKSLFEDHASANARFHHSIETYIHTGRMHIANRVALCFEMNTLPTAVRPLSGLKSYSGSLWGVFPHPKIQMESIAQQKSAGAKLNMTTGAVTLPNYVPKKAGMKAQFHHIIGALLIEVDSAGRVFPRHLIASEDGTFYDLDRRVSKGTVSEGHRAEAVVWGDIHEAKLDPAVAQGAFAYDKETRTASSGSCLLDYLKPERQVIHDLHDHESRNHHNINDIHFRFEMWVKGKESVEEEIGHCGKFLHAIDRPWCNTYVAESNHDQAFLRWLKIKDAYAFDPVNAVFFLRSQLRIHEQITTGLDMRDINIFEWAVRDLADGAMDRVEFLREDDTLMIKGIECALHGHRGANGSRGSLTGFANLATKTTVAHAHGPGIHDGSHQVGVCQLEMGYNIGPSNWITAHDVIYQNGKRALLIQYDDVWLAA